MLRASAGPTVDVSGHAGVEVGGEVATHLVGTQIAAAPVGVRVQAAALDNAVVGFIGVGFGDSAMPGFYGRDPSVPDWRSGELLPTCGYSGHLAGAIGLSSDGTTGIRAGFGLGHGRGVSRDGTRVKFVEAGAELAWQGNFAVGDDWDNVGNRITAAFYTQWTRIPADHTRFRLRMFDVKH